MKKDNQEKLSSTYIRLKNNAHAERIPVTPEFWPDLISGRLGDFHHEYLVTHLSFTEDWTTWEIHPNGDEIVILVNGSAEMIMEIADGEVSQSLQNPGDFAFVTSNTWHTANITSPCSMIFITAGEGTLNKERA